MQYVINLSSPIIQQNIFRNSYSLDPRATNQLNSLRIDLSIFNQLEIDRQEFLLCCLFRYFFCLNLAEQGIVQSGDPRISELKQSIRAQICKAAELEPDAAGVEMLDLNDETETLVAAAWTNNHYALSSYSLDEFAAMLRGKFPPQTMIFDKLIPWNSSVHLASAFQIYLALLHKLAKFRTRLFSPRTAYYLKKALLLIIWSTICLVFVTQPALAIAMLTLASLPALFKILLICSSLMGLYALDFFATKISTTLKSDIYMLLRDKLIFMKAHLSVKQELNHNSVQPAKKITRIFYLCQQRIFKLPSELVSTTLSFLPDAIYLNPELRYFRTQLPRPIRQKILHLESAELRDPALRPSGSPRNFCV